MNKNAANSIVENTIQVLSLDKLKLTELNLAEVTTLEKGRCITCTYCTVITKRSNLKLKNKAKQFLGYLLLPVALTVFFL
jgi:hypothetical protein